MPLSFPDEAGQRATTKRSSAHFVMSAVVLQESDLPQRVDLLDRIRRDLRRHPGEVLHWRNVRTHSERLRLRAVQLIAAADFLTLSTVVVGKHHFTSSTV